MSSTERKTKMPVVLAFFLISLSISSVSQAGWLRDLWQNLNSNNLSTEPPKASQATEDRNHSLFRPPVLPYADIIVSRAALATLPLGIQQWYFSETRLLNRQTDKNRLSSPAQNSQDALFTPEQANVFKLSGYWIDASELKIYSSALPADLQNLLTRKQNGKEQVLFFIHPESYAYYGARFNLSDFEKEDFLAAATASSRSLLVWKPGYEAHAFIAKVSLNAQIGGVNRTIKGEEAAMSIGVDMTLQGANDLPASFSTFPEVFSAIPTGMDRGAMIIRTFSADVVEGTRRFVPLFALYTQPPDGTLPLLVQMIQKSGEDPSEFVRNRIINPFVDEWFSLAVDSGILTEPHAQNVLAEINANGLPTGRFRHRDFGGFNIDFQYRNKLKAFVPDILPTFTGSVAVDYHQHAHEQNLWISLNNFFDAGFIFNVEEKMLDWSQAGLIPPSVKKGDLKTMILSRIEVRLERELGKQDLLNFDYYMLPPLLERARSQHLAAIVRCENVFGGL